jgi:hypothetical protein
VANRMQDEHDTYVLEDQDEHIAALLQAAGERWELSAPLGLHAALKRAPSGYPLHFLVARTPGELVTKIANADARDEQDAAS